jgi:hypothetical protein
MPGACVVRNILLFQKLLHTKELPMSSGTVVSGCHDVYKDYSGKRVVTLGHGEIIVYAALPNGKTHSFMTIVSAYPTMSPLPSVRCLVRVS